MSNFHVFIYNAFDPFGDDHPSGGMNDYYDSFDTLYQAVLAVEKEANLARLLRGCLESTIAVEHKGKLIEIIYSTFIDRSTQYWNSAVHDERINRFVIKLRKRKCEK